MQESRNIENCATRNSELTSLNMSAVMADIGNVHVPSCQTTADLNTMAKRVVCTDRVLPTRLTPNYRSLANNSAVTGTRSDPLNQLPAVGDCTLQNRTLLPKSMMYVRPMYGDIQTIQATGPDQVYGMSSPRTISSKLIDKVDSDMITSITMISGKPLSGRVMVGDARAITMRSLLPEKNSLPSAGTSNKGNTNRKPVDIQKCVAERNWQSNFFPLRYQLYSDKQAVSKLSQIDKMKASRLPAGDRISEQLTSVDGNERKTLSNMETPTSSEIFEIPVNRQIMEQVSSNRHNEESSSDDASDLLPKTLQSAEEEYAKPDLTINCNTTINNQQNVVTQEILQYEASESLNERNQAVFNSNNQHTSTLSTIDNAMTVKFSTSKNTFGSSSTVVLPSVVSTASGNERRNVVHWFRRGLRLHDNPALKEALVNCTTFRCIYILDPWFAGSSNVGSNKWRFLLQCLSDLDNSLRKLSSRLFVVRGQPANVFPRLFKEWETDVLSFEEDPEPFGRARDARIAAIAQHLNISIIIRTSHTLYNLNAIIEKNRGKPPLTYKTFQNILSMIDAPEAPVDCISANDVTHAFTPIREDHDDRYSVPKLEDLGFDTNNLPSGVWKGGETEALSRLKHHLERKAYVASFGHPKMTPQSLFACPTGLSPYLRFGCLSARKFYTELNELYCKIKKVPAPVSLHGQLLWREFFYTAATDNPEFDHMKGNPICVQIPWDRNPEALAKWAHGQTGFPWIDAIMTQLRNEGWIHNVARHAVACFLTRGDLWVSWEEGMKVFDELLLDADWSINAGSWMWLSCSSFFQQFFHCYCPVRYGRKADPNGDYIRTYLPVLKNFPTKYIHEPWKAPESVQRKARCLIGQHYPLPMVDHATQSRNNIERMRQVYQQLARCRTGTGQSQCSRTEEQRTSALQSSPQVSDARPTALTALSSSVLSSVRT